MANEAVIVELFGNPKGEPLNFTCGATDSIEKGALLWMTDNRTISGATYIHEGKPFAGVAATEKVNGDGSTTIGVFTKGVFDMMAISGAAIVAGDLVCISGQNVLAKYVDTTGISGGCIVGKSLEATSAGVNEVIQVLVGCR